MTNGKKFSDMSAAEQAVVSSRIADRLTDVLNREVRIADKPADQYSLAAEALSRTLSNVVFSSAPSSGHAEVLLATFIKATRLHLREVYERGDQRH